MRLILLALALLSAATAVASAGQAKTLRFAVAPCQFTGDAEITQWLGPGVAFDLEKRLERWPALQTSDRMRVKSALKLVNMSDEQAVANALLKQLNLDFAITFTGNQSQPRTELRARVWTKPTKAACEITAQGSLDQLMALHDKLTDGLVSELRDVFPDLAPPEKVDKLHIQPAKSTSVYRTLILGITALQNGKPAEAQLHLGRIERLEPGNWWSEYFLGAVEFHAGNFDKAIQRCRAAISTDPDLYPAIYANLAYCCQGVDDSERFRWAKGEFERRTSKSLPQRALPATGFVQQPAAAGGEKS